MVKITERVIPTLPTSITLTEEIVNGWELINHTTKEREIKNKDGSSSGTEPSIIVSNDNVPNLFLDYAAYIFADSFLDITSKMEQSEDKIQLLLNVQLEDLREEYPNRKTSKTNLTELENCLKIIVDKVSNSTLLGIIQLLHNEGYIEDNILTTRIIKRIGKKTVAEGLDKGNLKEILEETELSTISDKDAAADTKNEEKEIRESTIDYKSTVVKDIENKIQTSKPILNTKILENHLYVDIKKEKITITIKILDYFKNLFDKPFGDWDKSGFPYNFVGKDSFLKEIQVNEIFDIITERYNANKNIYEWLEKTKEMQEFDKFKKDWKFNDVEIKTINGILDYYDESLTHEKIHEITEKENGEKEENKFKTFFNDNKLLPADIRRLFTKIFSAYKQSQASTKIEEDEEPMEKQLLKSIVKTINIIKEEKESTKIEPQFTGISDRSSLLLIQRNIKDKNEYEEEMKFLLNNKQIQANINTKTDGHKDDMNDKNMENLAVDVAIINGERLDEIKNRFKADNTYNLYSVLTNTTSKKLSDVQLFKKINVEIKGFNDKETLKETIIEIMNGEIKPKRGLSDIKKDILFRITPQDGNLDLGDMVLNFKIDTEIVKALKDIGTFKDYLRRGTIVSRNEGKDIFNEKQQEKLYSNLGRVRKIMDILIDTERDLTTIFDDNSYFQYNNKKFEPFKRPDNETIRELIYSFIKGTVSSGSANSWQKESRGQTASIELAFKLLIDDLSNLDIEIGKIDQHINIQRVIDDGEVGSLKLYNEYKKYQKILKDLNYPPTYEDIKDGKWTPSEKYMADNPNWKKELLAASKVRDLSSMVGYNLKETIHTDRNYKHDYPSYKLFMDDKSKPYLQWFFNQDEVDKDKVEFKNDGEQYVINISNNKEKHTAFKSMLKDIKVEYNNKENKKLFNEFEKTDAYKWFKEKFKLGTQDEGKFPSWYEHGLQHYYIKLKNSDKNPMQHLKDLNEEEMQHLIDGINEAYKNKDKKVSGWDKKDQVLSMPEYTFKSIIKAGDDGDTQGKIDAIVPINSSGTFQEGELWGGSRKSDVPSTKHMLDEIELYEHLFWIKPEDRKEIIKTFESFAKITKHFTLITDNKKDFQGLTIYALLGLNSDTNIEREKENIIKEFRNFYIDFIFTGKDNITETEEHWREVFTGHLGEIEYIPVVLEKGSTWESIKTLDFKIAGQFIDTGYRNNNRREHNPEIKGRHRREREQQRSVDNDIFLRASNKYSKLLARSK